jgi:hypothetical protein
MASTTNAEHTYNLDELLRTDIRTQIPDSVVAQIISSPPFVDVPGALNIRDVSNVTTSPDVRRGFVYRSGTLIRISDEGKTKLARDLGVTKVFDLRNPSEREKAPSPVIEGIETVWLPYAATIAPVDAKDFERGDDGISGYLKMYLNILEICTPIFRAVFSHIKDVPEKPFLFHCSGKPGIISFLSFDFSPFIDC